MSEVRGSTRSGAELMPRSVIVYEWDELGELTADDTLVYCLSNCHKGMYYHIGNLPFDHREYEADKWVELKGRVLRVLDTLFPENAPHGDTEWLIHADW